MTTVDKDIYPTLGMLHDELAGIITKHRGAKKLADEPHAAAERWLDVIEKPHASEAPHKHVHEKTGQAFYTWAYRDRAVYTLRRFLNLSDEDRRTVMAAREDLIYWRGVDMAFFRRVIDETMTMRDMGREAYKAHARQQVRAIIKGKRSSAA